MLDPRALEPAGLHSGALRLAGGQELAGHGRHRGEPEDGVRALQGQCRRQPRRVRVREQLLQRQPLRHLYGPVTGRWSDGI